MSLIDATRRLVADAAASLHDPADVARLDQLAARLDEPLRVAIAGNVKAGKSTLLNALVGEQLAPTDAGECTRVVTWYREGLTYRARLTPRGGPPIQTRLSRDGGAVEVDLCGWSADDLECIEVAWPSAALRSVTLIDTPGLASLSADVSDRTRAFLAPDDDQPTAADAVLYLMRRAHPADARFLEAFHDEEAARASPVNAIGVLARADEIGSGRLDALDSARRVAAGWRSEPQLRRLVQTVVPIAGLIGATGATLAEGEFRILRAVAATPDGERDRLLLTADRFATLQDGQRHLEAVGVTAEDRRHLLDRLGLFGVRIAVELIRRGEVVSATELAAELQRLSGLMELREVLATHFTSRRDALKARSVLLALQPLLARGSPGDSERLAGALERILAGAHELAELRLLAALRAGDVRMSGEDLEVERLLGAEGVGAAARAGCHPDAEPGEVRDRLLHAIARWRVRAESPMAVRAESEAARVLVRSCEGALEAAEQQVDRPRARHDDALTSAPAAPLRRPPTPRDLRSGGG